jgi:hypothetical protein
MTKSKLETSLMSSNPPFFTAIRPFDSAATHAAVLKNSAFGS